MRHCFLVLLVSSLVIGLAGAAGATDKQVTVEVVPYTQPTDLNFGPAGPAVSCQVGNLNPYAWAISNFVLPPEDYKFAFDPMTTCSVCQVGFKINKVHVYLQFAAACEVYLSVDVEDAIYTQPDCPAPGPVLCQSALYVVNIPSAGLFNIGIPIVCDCFAIGQKYLLSVHFESSSCTPALITDAGPGALCKNWNNYGGGWYDLVAQYPTWPGQFIFFADAECCTPPVPVDSKTWGEIKELYKD